MSLPTSIVSFKNATKRFGNGQTVLANVSLDAHQGDFVSVIGPSGCGKSTLLRLIAGLIPLSEGQLNIGGRPILDQQAGELAVVFQEPTLLPWLTVRRNVEVMLRLRHTPSDQRCTITNRMLDLVGLTPFAAHYPRQLSGGQKMRVSIARALTLQPSLLLLDEPFGALDEMTRDRLNEELLSIRKRQQWTAFFVTHSVAEAVFLSNRIIVLAANPGRIAHEVAVDLPYPRTTETRLSADYLKQVADVSRLLRSAEITSVCAAV